MARHVTRKRASSSAPSRTVCQPLGPRRAGWKLHFRGPFTSKGFDVLVAFNPRAYGRKRTPPPAHFKSIIEIFRSRRNYFNYFSLVFETHSRVTN